MKTKIKLILWSFLTILIVWLSSTYALELNWLRSSDKTCLANKNGQNLIDRGWNYGDKYYFTCIEGREAQSELDKYWRKIQVEQFESKTYKLIYSQDSYVRPFKYKNRIEWGAFSDYFKLWKDEKWLYVFSKFTKGNNTIYRRNMLKINEDTPVKVVSRRGWTVYKQGYVLNGIQLYTKHGNQGRLASVIDNTYILDWYGFVVDNRTLRVMDTYANKMYKYYSLTDNDLSHLPRVLFYNLYNQVPDDIYDVVWNKWSYWYFYWKDSEYINYELENSKKGTEEDLKKIQQDLKNSIQILNKEDIDFYLGMQPEELWISSNPDLPKNQDKWENNENNKSYEENLKEYNSCTSYRNNIKTYTTYDKECYRSLLDSAPLTWSVNHKKLLAPRNAVVNWNGEGELDIDTEDRICLQFKDRKAVYKQKRSKQWEEFQAISKENWLSPSGINVAEKCGQRPERSLWGKITHPSESFQNWRDSFNWFWWSAIVVSGDQKLYNYDYRADTEELKRLRELCFEKDFMERNFLKEEEVDQQKKHYCERYYKKKAEILKKYQNWDNFFNGKTLTWYINEIWSWDHQYVDLKRLKSFLDRISKPYESWFNSIDFVKPMCWSYKTDFFNIFIYVFFFGWVLYFIKILK